MAAGGIKSQEILNELESHLLDEVDQRLRAGLDPQQAFEAAVRQMGRVEVLKTEFAKVQTRGDGLRRTLEAICCVEIAGFITLASAFAFFRIARGLSAAILLLCAVACIALFVRVWRRADQIREALNNMSPSGERTLQLAREEAPRLLHNFIGTEHLLLGLTGIETGSAANVMKRLGLSRDLVTREVETLVKGFPAQAMIENVPYTPRVKKALLLAKAEAKVLNHAGIEAEHILLGLLLEGDGIAARVLKKVGVRIEDAREAILKES